MPRRTTKYKYPSGGSTSKLYFSITSLGMREWWTLKTMVQAVVRFFACRLGIASDKMASQSYLYIMKI